MKDYEDKLTKNRAIGQKKYMDNSVIVLSSKDPIKVYVIKDALSSHNIGCVALDSQSSQMMGFLPDAEMRVMVPREDFDQSVKILDSIKELKQPDA